MILIDFSGISVAAYLAGHCEANDIKGLRHTILNSIRIYRNKHRDEYGEIVLVADGIGNWREDIFPQYKECRAKTKVNDKYDWDTFSQTRSIILDELMDHVPYAIIRQDGCEADDAISELVRYEHNKPFGEKEKVLIISADKDFIQLQAYGHVDQINPVTKKHVHDDDPDMYRRLHILAGCPTDDVPNVLSDDLSKVEGRRATTLSAKKKATLLEDPHAFGDEVYKNYQRNYSMINLMDDTDCPDVVRSQIISSYEGRNKRWRKNVRKLMPYLMSNGHDYLISKVHDFVKRLERL